MRALNIIRGDIRFQMRYGFYFLYLVFTILYMVILTLVPDSLKEIVASILIFSDPCAIGFFFMGAIVLLEKSQCIMHSFAVSPLRTHEYILAKIVSLGFVSVLVALPLALLGGTSSLLLTLIGVILSSTFCSLCSLIIAMRADTLNQFLIMTIPIELIIFVPTFYYLFVTRDIPYLAIHPGVIALNLISGNSMGSVFGICILLVWNIITFYYCHYVVSQTFKKVGGGH